MKRRDADILEHIADYCDDIENARARFGNSFDVFATDVPFQQSVAFCVLQIGELATKLTDEFKEETKDAIPWRQIRGMRNVVAHGYGTIELDELWGTAVNDIPQLREFCAETLASPSSEIV